MANTIRVDVVSAERELFSGEAQMVFAPAENGEVGIAPNHSAFLSPLVPGDVRVQMPDGNEEFIYVSGGMLEVQPHVVTILSDTGVRGADIDEAAVLKAKEAAEQALRDRSGVIEEAVARAQLAETLAQLQTLRRMRSRGGR